jgi:hypothetical protein
MNLPSDPPIVLSADPSAQVERLRAIAYSMDTLVPGLYFWSPLGNGRIGGSLAEATYPGRVHSRFGLALVLPGYRIFTTYRDSYDPRSPQN